MLSPELNQLTTVAGNKMMEEAKIFLQHLHLDNLSM